MSIEDCDRRCEEYLARHDNPELVRRLLALGAGRGPIVLCVPDSLVPFGGRDAGAAGGTSAGHEAGADVMEEGMATEASPTVDDHAEKVSETERSGDGSSDAAASGPSGAAALDDGDGDGHSEAAGPSAATAAGSSAQLLSGRCPIAWANQVPLEDVVNGNVIVKPKTRYKQCSISIIRRLSAAVCEQQGGVCKGCGTKKFEIKDGKVIYAHLDHFLPVSLVGVCPLQAARTYVARLAIALDETVMQLLCPPCHTLKTNEDNRLAAQAAMSTLFWWLLKMPLPWTVDRLVRLFPHDTMQRRLREQFEAGLAEAGETWQDYELGEHLMPVFRCEKCKGLAESRFFTWVQDMTESQKTRRVRATILSPQCSCGARATIPVTFRPTKWLRYSRKSVVEQLAKLRSAHCVGWLKPKNSEQVAEWGEKIARDEVWFREPSDTSAR
jgi:5-methylcytosine-specific restriction endonuclease McrA